MALESYAWHDPETYQIKVRVLNHLYNENGQRYTKGVILTISEKELYEIADLGNGAAIPYKRPSDIQRWEDIVEEVEE